MGHSNMTYNLSLNLTCIFSIPILCDMTDKYFSDKSKKCLPVSYYKISFAFLYTHFGRKKSFFFKTLKTCFARFVTFLII